MTTSISRQFARWAVGLRYEDLPAAVVEKVKALILFHLVADLFGHENPHTRELIALVKAEEPKPDGATVLVDGARVTRYGAAFANTELAHVAGLWDSFRMITHPGPVLISVGLVNAELANSSARELITALAAGYEFHCRLADDFVPSTSARGFRPAPIFATMGAAMVAGKLLGLDEDRLVAAIAIAASSASGLNEPGRVGVNEREVQEPNAARQGVFAALMGAGGHVRGAETSIEGDAGFYAAYAGSRDGRLSYVFTGERQIDLASITADLGSNYKLLRVMFRIYNASGYNQPVIELMTELKREHGFAAEDVEEVRISMNYLETLYPSPEFPQYPDPSIIHVRTTGYYAAHVAVNGGYPVVGGDTFGPTGNDLEHDTRVLEFMATRVRLIGVHDQPMFSPSIAITLRSGETIEGTYPYARMEWMLTELVENLERCVPRMPGGRGRLDALVELVRDLETFTSVAPIVTEMCRA